MVAATARTRTQVQNITRVQLMQNTAQSFIDVASDNGADTEFVDERLEVMLKMELITAIEMVISDGDEPVAGARMEFDWNRHAAIIKAEGEFIDPDLINGYESTDTISETIEVLRTYITRICEGCDKASVDFWYTLNPVKFSEFGRERFGQILGLALPEEKLAADKSKWAKIKETKERNAKRINLADLQETTINVWGES